jgi:AcrR family transcriptional regulator
MQYLKDEVKNRIIEETLKEFNLMGYKGSSVRNIAANSCTSVGNLYKYFKNKDDLYESVIGTVYSKLMNYIVQFKNVEFNNKTQMIFYELMDKIIEIFEENSIELSVLFNKSQGSRYEDCKKVFIDFITRIVTENTKYELSLKGKKLKDNFLIYLLSYSLVESIGIILEKKQDGEEVRKLTQELIDIFYKDILNRVSAV